MFIVITTVMVFSVVQLKKSGLSQILLIEYYNSIALVIVSKMLLLLGHRRRNNNALRPEGEINNR